MRILDFGSYGFTVAEYPPRRTQRGKAATKDEKANFTTKVTKSTKLRSLEISMSETFVSFVLFVVNKYIRVMSEYSQRSLKNLDFRSFNMVQDRFWILD
jgi:hypothetical protein